MSEDGPDGVTQHSTEPVSSSSLISYRLKYNNLRRFLNLPNSVINAILATSCFFNFVILSYATA